MIQIGKAILAIGLLAIIGLVLYAVVNKKNVNEMALSIFSLIKQAQGKSVDFSALNSIERPVAQHDLWDELLREYVNEKGNVDYAAWLKTPEKLDQYLAQISATPPGENWTEAQVMAYWINAYNAFTVRLILNHYPLKSIKDIADGLPMINSPWDISFFEIGGIDFDLNTIEHEILRKQFDEPRMHFAINCASRSCPILRMEAYRGDQLEQQLSEQARAFLSDPDKNQLRKNELKISQIFSWFASDFRRGQSLYDFLRTYTDVPFSDDVDLTYLEYDWSLNE